MEMNCPFCQDIMYENDRRLITGQVVKKYACHNDSCAVNNDISRYHFSTIDGKIYKEEYALGNFYVKVFLEGSYIYRLNHCFLEGEISVPRPLWLNVTNTAETLDKLKLMATFS